MDPRQPPQHPFSRNTASPYGRTPFPPSANPPPFPPSSHPPNATPAYPEHQRRPSEPSYYPQRSYAPDGPPMGGPGHSRHQSASSIGGRGMPPPSSPQQSQQPHHNYGAPPPPRGPPVSVGPPSAFPSGRDLPTLPPLGVQRPPSTGMSISSMLGGPPARDPSATQYGSPNVTTAGGPIFPGTAHASPRMSAASDYAPFRRPQTPEHRPYEPRDNRANSAGSPPGIGSYGTPDGRSRFGTPGRPQGMPLGEERREPIRVPNPNAVPPRPSSQPNAYGAPPPRRVENPRNPPYQENMFGRRPPDAVRQHQDERERERDIQRERERDPRLIDREREREPPYQRAAYDERQVSYGYAERERQEREREATAHREREIRDRELREREIRERERIAEHTNNVHQEYAHQQAHRNAQNGFRISELGPRPEPNWARPDPRPAYDQPPPERPPPQSQPPNGYEYPTTAAPQYRDQPAYAPNEPRYPMPQAASAHPQHGTVPATAFEAYIEREQRDQRNAQMLHQQQQQQQQSIFGGPSQNGPYQSQESPLRRDMEDPQQMQRQRSFLGVQEINRKGRVSPLPQAVQGAQGQMGGPGGEPGIKSEFGRMFSGIGSGVGAMGAPSPVTAGLQGLPFSNQLRREDMENLPDSPMENGGNKLARSSSRGGGPSRRRKLKEEDSRGDDESSTGRRTPSGRGKRAKTHHHHHH
ncbi:hypothetical protein LSUE1_G008440, partial [Lachnellula suecica]